MSSKKLFPNGEAAREGSVRRHGNQRTLGIFMALSGLAAVVSVVALLFMVREVGSMRDQLTFLRAQQETSHRDLHDQQAALHGDLRDQQGRDHDQLVLLRSQLQDLMQGKHELGAKTSEQLSPEGPTSSTEDWRREDSATFGENAEVHHRSKREVMANTVLFHGKFGGIGCPSGAPGRDGRDGLQGPAGPPGPPGQCCSERPIPSPEVATSPGPISSSPRDAGTTAAPRRTQVTAATSAEPGEDAQGIQVRLAGGSTPLAGRVEVRNETGPWGSVCDERWDLQDARVVCRQLGFGTALEAKLAGHFGEGPGSVWLDEVACGGDETNLGDCPAEPWGQSDCSHKEDAGVVCGGKLAVRLAGGHVPWEGRVEIRPGDKSEWGAVCNTSWTEAETGVMCKQLGYTGGVSSAPTDIPTGTGRTWLGHLTCSGTEPDIASCSFGWDSSGCPGHGQNIQVVCTGALHVRLNGSENPSEGRVEIRTRNGDWGTVCDDGFGDRDAQVVCRQLRFYTGFARVGGVFPEGTGDIWLENLSCEGNESSVADCGISRWGDHDCSHMEDAGVICVPASDCAEYYAAGQTTSGVYNIRLSSSTVEVYCDMDTAGGGWTVIQRRQDGSVPFNRNWEEYKRGFGNKSGEYWLGNENIHLLTSQKNYTLRVDLKGWDGATRYATYSSFRVSGESDQYRLTISGYSGTAGDSMDHNNGRMFSTVDRDNDAYSGHCSQRYGQGGWWFRACSYSFLNGRYLRNCGSSCEVWQGVVWHHWRYSSRYSLKSVSMKIRP